MQLYNASARAVKDVHPSLKVGGPATAGLTDLPAFVAACAGQCTRPFLEHIAPGCAPIYLFILKGRAVYDTEFKNTKPTREIIFYGTKLPIPRPESPASVVALLKRGVGMLSDGVAWANWLSQALCFSSALVSFYPLRSDGMVWADWPPQPWGCPSRTSSARTTTQPTASRARPRCSRRALTSKGGIRHAGTHRSDPVLLALCWPDADPMLPLC